MPIIIAYNVIHFFYYWLQSFIFNNDNEKNMLTITYFGTIIRKILGIQNES